MVLTRRGRQTGRIEDEINRLQMYYNQRNEACQCGERNGDCSCGSPVESSSNDISQYYKANDTCHRHRKPDNEPKTQTVSSYKRREKVN
jgi:hypothetical protein